MYIKQEILEDLVNKNYTKREVSNLLNVGYSTVYKYMSFYGLKFKITELQKNRLYINHHCNICGETNSNNFYRKRRTECKKCGNKRGAVLLRDKRKKLIDELGGKCQNCGYYTYIGALEFHHPNPTKKDPKWNTTKNWNYNQLKEEIKECKLLCSNCHREEHHKMRQ